MHWREYRNLLEFFQKQILESPTDEFWKQQLVDLVKNQQEYESKAQDQEHAEVLKQIEADAEVEKEEIKKDILYDYNSMILRLADKIDIEPSMLVDRLRLVSVE